MTKKEFFDSQIMPHMKVVFALCEEKKINYSALFQFDTCTDGHVDMALSQGINDRSFIAPEIAAIDALAHHPGDLAKLTVMLAAKMDGES